MRAVLTPETQRLHAPDPRDALGHADLTLDLAKHLIDPGRDSEESGTAPAPPRPSTQPVDPIQAEIPYFNTKCWSQWHVHLGPREKYVCDLNSYPFPAAVPGLLGLDRKWRKGLQKSTAERGELASAVSGGSLLLVSPAGNSLAPSLACILGSPRCLLSIRERQWQLAGLAMWQNSLSFCPKATWSLA